MPKLPTARRGFTEDEERAWQRAGQRYRERKRAKRQKKRRPSVAASRRTRKPKSRTPPGHPKSIRVVILTYERPEALLRLLRDVYAWRGAYKVSVVVYDDASEADYSAPREMLRGLGWEFVRASEHHGKHEFWRWVRKIHADQRERREEFFVFLPDDARLCSAFFQRLCSQWAKVSDPYKISRNPLHDTSGNRGWTKQTSRPVGDVLLTGCVDMAAGCPKRYLEALGFSCPRVPSARWRKNKTLGSGVGQVISIALFEQGLSMYSVRRSLIVHTGINQSHMNPESRARYPLRAVGFVDGERAHARLLQGEDPVVVSVASMAYRAKLLRKVIDSLYWQVDRINVYLDRYMSIPKFLNQPKIHVAQSQEHGDIGDAGKFFWAGDLGPNYYHFTCDDDLLYPPDYVARMIAKIEQYNRRAIVTLQGTVIPRNPTRSYYAERTSVSRWARTFTRDQPVHIPGTGVLAYHTSTIELHRRMFRHKNMADIWIGVAAKKAQVPIIVIRHSGTWIRGLPDPDRQRSIFARYVGRDHLQARVVRQAGPWGPPLTASGVP
jgi:hypothetical protein